MTEAPRWQRGRRACTWCWSWVLCRTEC